jgi:FAD/FMN-containing dehydrogenase
MDDLIRDLRKRVAGEVRFDPMTKVLYSTDASIYEIEPLGVVIPRTTDDALACRSCRAAPEPPWPARRSGGR